MKRFAGYSVLLLLLIAAVYAQTADFSFVRLDDHDYTFRCPFVMNGFSFANLKAAFLSVTHAAIWMPATYLTYMLDISLFGPGMGVHHIVNVVIHAINTILVFYFLLLLSQTMRGQTPAAIDTQNGGGCIGGQTLAICFFAAAVWALHPLRCEGVAWIAGRKELLWTMFTLAGLIAWYKERWRLGCIACALACMSKPTAMIFPLLAVFVEWYRNTDKEGVSPVAEQDIVAPLKKYTVRYLPLFAMAALTGVLAVYSQTHPAGYEDRALFASPLWWRCLNAAVTLGLTVFQTFIPYGIHADYRSMWLSRTASSSVLPQGMWIGLVVLIAVVVFAVAVWRKSSAKTKKNIQFAVLWLLIGFLPVLGIYGSFGEHARADRFTYLPSIGFSILIVIAAVGGMFDKFGKKLKVVAGVIVLGLSVAASIVTNSWKNDATLFERVLKFDPDHGRALAHIGSDLCARNRFDLGIGYFRKSMKLRPRNDTASQLAFALAMRGNEADFEEIEELCSFAVGGGSDPKGMALEALGMVAMAEKKFSRAIKYFDASLKAPARFYPEEDTRLRRAICLMRLGRKEEARKELLPLANNARLGIRAAAIEYLRQLR